MLKSSHLGGATKTQTKIAAQMDGSKEILSMRTVKFNSLE